MILAIQTLNVSTQLVAFNVYVIQDIMEMEYFVWVRSINETKIENFKKVCTKIESIFAYHNKIFL